MWYIFGSCAAMTRALVIALSNIHTRSKWAEERWYMDILIWNVLPATNHGKYCDPHFKLNTKVQKRLPMGSLKFMSIL